MGVRLDVSVGQGNDFAGVVEEVGSAIKNIAVGDKIIGHKREASA